MAIRAHGILMTIAWVVLLPLGMLTPSHRYAHRCLVPSKALVQRCHLLQGACACLVQRCHLLQVPPARWLQYIYITPRIHLSSRWLASSSSIYCLSLFSNPCMTSCPFVYLQVHLPLCQDCWEGCMVPSTPWPTDARLCSLPSGLHSGCCRVPRPYRQVHHSPQVDWSGRDDPLGSSDGDGLRKARPWP